MRFLGPVNYFSRFVDHLAELLRPLYEMIKGTGFSKKRKKGTLLIIKDWEKRWGEEQRSAWKFLKDILGNTDSLAAQRRGVPKKVMTDAISYGLGGALLQLEEDSTWRPVSFTSRQLKKAEISHPVHQKGCLAVVQALKKWKHYLHGERFVVVADQLS